MLFIRWLLTYFLQTFFRYWRRPFNQVNCFSRTNSFFILHHSSFETSSFVFPRCLTFTEAPRLHLVLASTSRSLVSHRIWSPARCKVCLLRKKRDDQVSNLWPLAPWDLFDFFTWRISPPDHGAPLVYLTNLTRSFYIYPTLDLLCGSYLLKAQLGHNFPCFLLSSALFGFWDEILIKSGSCCKRIHSLRLSDGVFKLGNRLIFRIW